MSYTTILLHCVWSTKNREPLLLDSHNRFQLYTHIYHYSRSKNIHIDHVGGYIDHIHILLFLKCNQNISNCIKHIKGESSYWYSKAGYGYLLWQDDYFATSVSIDRIDTVRRYIRNQEIHHKKATFEKEYDEFMLNTQILF